MIGVVFVLVAVLFIMASPQDWYGAFKTIHVVFAVIWIGGGFLISALAFIAELEHDVEGRSILARQAASVSQRVFTPSALIVLFMGLAMMLNDTGTALGAGAASGSRSASSASSRPSRSASACSARRRSAWRAIVASGGANTPEAHAEMNRIFLVARADAAILMLVVVDMVAKPFLLGRACQTRSIEQSTYRLDELGWLQFEQLCDELLAAHGLEGCSGTGTPIAGGSPLSRRCRRRWSARPAAGRRWSRPRGRAAAGKAGSSRSARSSRTPWIPWRASRRSRRSSCSRTPRTTSSGRSAMACTSWAGRPSAARLAGRDRLGALIDAAPAVRRRVPTVLGVRDLDPLLAAAGSSWDEAAARELAASSCRRAPTGARSRRSSATASPC